ncbi:MAG: DUF3189 family protein [Candidatus Syntrophonatronum acetioxidans]|uniref:DUF3189 family protein n=1 Tax=Candidatus Syntrophonatronum acetioxidans TaxID=1795816 RepID=A0A424YAL2_9FIRM|nr:MAG: DUF3189 family protein [Candidatus Syntrophonatronum acetioxidans]
MVLIYHCFGSAHSSVVASAIHLGMLPLDRVPRKEEIVTLPHYDQTTRGELGNPFYVGRDEYNWEVYILGLANQKELAKRAIWSLLKIYNVPFNYLFMVDSLNSINNLTRLGGFLSRRLGLVNMGRPLTIKGIQKGYLPYVKLVDQVKRKVREGGIREENFNFTLI